MYFLNNLKEYCLYKDKKIVGIDSTNRQTDLKKGTVVVYADEHDGINNFLSNGILSNSHFKSYYVPRKFNTKYRNMIKIIDQKEIYKKVMADNNQINRTKLKISDYGSFNLIYDLHYELQASLNERRLKGITRSVLYLNLIADKVNSLSQYRDKIVAIPVEDLSAEVDNEGNFVIKTPFDMFYNAVYRKKVPESLYNIPIILYTKNGYIMKVIIKENINKNKLIQGLNKIKNASKSKIVIEDDLIITNDKKTDLLKKDEIVDKVVKNITTKINLKKNFNNDKNLQAMVDNIETKITKKLNNYEDLLNTPIEDLINDVEQDEEIVKEINVVATVSNNGITDEKEIARLKKIQDEKLDKFEDVLKEIESLKLEEIKIDNNNILNEEPKKSSLVEFDDSYVNKLMQKDLVNIFKAFNNDPDVKMFIKDVKYEDTSDFFTKKVTYTITYVDDKKNVHRINIDYPILKDNKFMIIGGGKKLLLKQFLLYPIVKTKSDEVQLTTSYNKMIIRRFGSKLNDGTDNITKLFSGELKDAVKRGKNLKYSLGNNTVINKDYITSLEYSQLAKFINYIKNDIVTINFSQIDLNSILFETTDKIYDNKLANLVKDKKMYDRERYFVIGFYNDKSKIILGSKSDPMIYTYDGSNMNMESVNLSEFINKNIIDETLMEDKQTEYYRFKPSKTLMYNRIKINNKHIPLIIVLAYERGLRDILNRYEIQYEFKETVRQGRQYGKKQIKFSNGVLIYNSLDLKSTLLLDGLTTMETVDYNFEDFDTKIPYIEYFFEAFGSRNIGKGIHNTLTLMLQDPITLDCLKMLKLPTNIYDLLLYANTLLTDSTYNPGNDMNNYRLRGAEQINSVLYKLLADAFRSYKDTLGNANPVKMSIPRDALLKELVGLKTVDEYSILNPSLEVDKISAVTFKGPSGINLDQNLKMSILIFNSFFTLFNNKL